MRKFKVDTNKEITTVELLALILSRSKEARIHPVVSDRLDYANLHNKLRAMPVHVALVTCSRLLRAVSALYAVNKIMKGDYDDCI